MGDVCAAVRIAVFFLAINIDEKKYRKFALITSCSGAFINFVTGNTLLAGGIAFGVVKHLVKNGTIDQLTDAQIAFKTFFMAFCASSALFVVLGSIFTALKYDKAEGMIDSVKEVLLDGTWLHVFPLGCISNAVCYAVDRYENRDSKQY